MVYPTRDQLKSWVNETTSTHDANLQIVLDGCIALVERETSRVFVAVATTAKYAPVRPYVNDGLVLSLMRDIVTITALVDGMGDVIPTADYYLYSASGAVPYYQVRLLPNSAHRFSVWDGETRIAVTGTWGKTAACPADLFTAILQLGKYIWGARSTGQGGPVATASRRGGLVVAPAEIPANIMDVIKGHAR